MQASLHTVEELLAHLVSFDTTSSKSNLSLIHFVEDYLNIYGLSAHRIQSSDGKKACLFVSIGPENDKGIALSGHTDVVPVEGQKWHSDPFKLRFKDGRYYGRGTADMKGFLACMLFSVPHFLKLKLRKPIHLAFSYDEEIGCLGVRPMIAEFGKNLPRPQIVIVGEPTEMKVVEAHKGPVRWHITVEGRAAHSSMSHLGVNAISWAGHILNELSRIEEDLKDTRDPRFVPPYSTLQVTKIKGGTASNIVPISCQLGVELRAIETSEIEKIEERIETFLETKCAPAMASTAPEAGVSFYRTNYVPPFKAEQNSEAVALALALLKHNATSVVSYATEAGLFQSAGSSAIVCGPGSIAEAHTANEWIAESELKKCTEFLERLGAWCAE